MSFVSILKRIVKVSDFKFTSILFRHTHKTCVGVNCGGKFDFVRFFACSMHMFLTLHRTLKNIIYHMDRCRAPLSFTCCTSYYGIKFVNVSK